MPRSLRSIARVFFLVALILVIAPLARPQDASTGAIRGIVLDPEGRAAGSATIGVVGSASGAQYSAISDADGRFCFELLPPGDYSARAEIKGMSPEVTPPIHVDVGGVSEIQFHLSSEPAKPSPCPERHRWSRPFPVRSPRSSTKRPSMTCRSMVAGSPISLCWRQG